MPVSADIKKEMLALVDTKAFYEAVCVTAEIDRKRISRKQVNEYLRKWVNAKAWMFELFGHKLELVREVEIPADGEVMRGNIEELCRKYPAYAATIKELRTEDFSEGVISRQSSAFLKQIFPRVYRVGAKTSKVLSKILSDYDFDVELSKVLQNNMVKGRVVVSINPLDYVMLSTNTHKWGSCMSILYDKNDRTSNRGGFNKTGGYSLMMDKATTIAYLDHNKVVRFANDYGSLDWHDMVFRQLITLDKGDLNNIVYGHYNGTVSDKIRGVWGEMLCGVMGGKDWKMHNNAPRNNQHGAYYYDVGSYNWYGSSEPKPRTMGVKELWCVCCGKKFNRIHAYKNWLSCEGKCLEKKTVEDKK